MEKDFKLVECKKIKSKDNLIIIQVIHNKKIYHAIIDSGS